MKKKPLYMAVIVTQVLLMGCPSYGADIELPQAPPILSEMDQALKAMAEALAQQKEQGDEDIEKRMGKRADARDLQKAGKKLKKKVKSATSPLGKIGTIASNIASASGDLHLKMAAAIFKVTITAATELGGGVAQIMIGVGRYQERTQEILSITELLVEDMRKSIDTMKALQKKQNSLLGISKTSEPKETSSLLKRFTQKLYSVPTKIVPTNIQNNIQNKVQRATDIFTNDKIDREKKLKGIQEDLKKEKEHFSEIIKLLQIKLLQDAVKEIDKKINLDTIMNTIKFKDDNGIEKEKAVTVYGTIDKLKNDIKFYTDAKAKISTKSESEAEKQLAEIEEKLSRAQTDLDFYVDFQENLKDGDKKKLEEDKKILIEKINELTRLTKMGSTPTKEESDSANTLSRKDIDYLQSKKANINNPDANKQTIVALWSTIADLYREIDTLKKGAQPLQRSLPTPPQRPNQNANNQQRPSTIKQ